MDWRAACARERIRENHDPTQHGQQGSLSHGAIDRWVVGDRLEVCGASGVVLQADACLFSGARFGKRPDAGFGLYAIDRKEEAATVVSGVGMAQGDWGCRDAIHEKLCNGMLLAAE